MFNTAYLVLENGMTFKGRYFGATGEVTGEIVFTTGMTGYLETLTDPSYYGQIVLQTFPLIGNYGVIPADFESAGVSASAYIVKHPCRSPSNFRSEGNIDDFLRERGIVGLCGIDTRALTRVIRENGVMNGRIMGKLPTETDLNEIKAYKTPGPIARVSIAEKRLYEAVEPKLTVALIDYGTKENIKRELLSRGCRVWMFPFDSAPEDILGVSPDGIMLSSGPGDPADPVNAAAVETIRVLMKECIPIFGVCIGHQLLALANGFGTSKLKYGHRGENQPVKENNTGKVYITCQNHGYAVRSGSIDERVAEQWFVNVNDGTCEGLAYKNIPAFTVQFHPEASGGPQDTAFLFDRFIESMEVRRNAAR